MVKQVLNFILALRHWGRVVDLEVNYRNNPNNRRSFDKHPLLVFANLFVSLDNIAL